MSDEDVERQNEEGTNIGLPAQPEHWGVLSGHQIVSFSNMPTEERQLDLIKISGGHSPFSSDKNENVYGRMMDCAQFSLDSISATIGDNSIIVTGQLEEDGNVSSKTMTIPRNILEKYDMEKVEAWLRDDKTLFISLPKKHGPVVSK